MSDYRNSQSHISALSRGFYSNKKGKVVYELDEYLPPITDFVYCPGSDTWIRRETMHDEETSHEVLTEIPGTQLAINTKSWISYRKNNHKTLTKNEDGFLIDEHNDRNLQVLPLISGDEREYISLIYNSDILALVLGYCCDDRVTYMRLRLVSKKIKTTIDSSETLVRYIHRFIILQDVSVSVSCLYLYPITARKAIIQTQENVPICCHSEEDKHDCFEHVLNILEQKLDKISSKTVTKARLKKLYAISTKIINYIKREERLHLKIGSMISKLTLTVEDWETTIIHINICGKSRSCTLSCFMSIGISKVFNVSKGTYYSYKRIEKTLIQDCIDENRSTSIFYQSKPMIFLRGFGYLE